MGWRRNIYSYPPIGTPDGGAYVAVGDLIAFHRALLVGVGERASWEPVRVFDGAVPDAQDFR